MIDGIQKINPLQMFIWGHGIGHKKFTLLISSQKNTTPMSLIGSPRKLDSRLRNVIDAEINLDVEGLKWLKGVIDRELRFFERHADLPLALLGESSNES